MIYLEDSDITDSFCVGEGSSGKLSIEPCSYMEAHDFTTTVMNEWGLYSPGGRSCQGWHLSSNVSDPSVLKDDTIGGNICVGLQASGA